MNSISRALARVLLALGCAGLAGIHAAHSSPGIAHPGTAPELNGALPPPPEESDKAFAAMSAYLKPYPFPPAEAIDPRLRVISRGDPKSKVVALTFDDGPKPRYTLELLGLLDKLRVRATFFYVGAQCDNYPELVRQTALAGHEIGNHTYSHCRFPNLDTGQKRYEIDRCQHCIAALTGVQPRFLRPPGGHRDSEVERLLGERHMAMAMWDASLDDIQNWSTAKTTLHMGLMRIRPGSIVLAHTGSKSTLEALPELVATLRERGYEFVTLSELASGVSPKEARGGRGESGIPNAGFSGR